ncbi:putative large subunit ribosomal protein L21e [Paratrimastix pyriformis]|uniref:Large subunit ribosomal protein L21e n=1 Tax=Paratrimastix pyriformis TaxID=342808 RepID=A0ABQ8ULE5_9EUKA|nr:putative large subunit ribosomal protein L21e [Paratrimastix pyriformis]
MFQRPFRKHGVVAMTPYLHVLLASTGKISLSRRIHIRVEHCKPSTSRDAFVQRVKENDMKARQAKKEGKRIVIKRLPTPPKEGHFVPKSPIEVVTPLRYEFVM